MKIFICTVLFCTVVSQSSAQMEVFTFKNGDITNLLKNNALVKGQINCVMNKGPCDLLGKVLKLVLIEMVGRNCQSCSPEQTATARRLTIYLQRHYPEVYTALRARYGKPILKKKKKRTSRRRKH